MDLLHGQEYSKDNDIEEFTLIGPTGALTCKWLDVYFGLFEINGMEGAFRVKEFDRPDIKFEFNKQRNE